jgi:hypothetical protein
VSVADVLHERGIREILHFTTNHGLVGILQSGEVKSRAILPTEKTLEHVYSPNSTYRKDTAHLDYVNLSISEINLHLFGISSEKWHADEDVWWTILSFDPEITTHDEVIFTTTNNIYTGVRRGTGEDALRRLFAERVTRWAGNDVIRPDGHAPHLPTCPQAEVLYPRQLSIDYLRRIYVREGNHADVVTAQFEVLNRHPVEVVIEPAVFE